MKMLNKSFKDHLLKDTDQEFVDILAPQLEGVNIINAKLAMNARGMALPSKIYVDINGILDTPSNGKYDLAFIILHELAHYKRIQKKGKEWYLDYILKYDEDMYVDFTIFEEAFADRWATLMVHKLFNISHPSPNRDYSPTGSIANMSRYMFKAIRNSVRTEEELEDSLKQYILHVRQ